MGSLRLFSRRKITMIFLDELLKALRNHVCQRPFRFVSMCGLAKNIRPGNEVRRAAAQYHRDPRNCDFVIVEPYTNVGLPRRDARSS